MLNVSKPVAYIILGISIAMEIAGDSALESCDGYKHKLMSVIAFVLILGAFYTFSKVLHIINISIAYATWTAVGTLACALLGVFFFAQDLTPIGWISVILLAAATFAMNMWGAAPSEEPEEKLPEQSEEVDG